MSGLVQAAPATGPQFDNRRVLAALVDGLVLLPVTLVLVKLCGGLSLAAGTLAAAWALFYYFALESEAGQTLGKRLLGIRVAAPDGSPPDLRQVAVRTLLRPIDAIGAYLLGLVVMMATGDRRQRLGDLAAGTVVTSADAPAEAQAAPPGPHVTGPALPPIELALPPAAPESMQQDALETPVSVSSIEPTAGGEEERETPLEEPAPVIEMIGDEAEPELERASRDLLDRDEAPEPELESPSPQPLPDEAEPEVAPLEALPDHEPKVEIVAQEPSPEHGPTIELVPVETEEEPRVESDDSPPSPRSPARVETISAIDVVMGHSAARDEPANDAGPAEPGEEEPGPGDPEPRTALEIVPAIDLVMADADSEGGSDAEPDPPGHDRAS